MAWPSVLTSFSYPNATDRLNSPSHSSVEGAQNTALSELQVFIGTQSSTVGTLIYDVRSPSSNGGGHVQTANKGGTGQTSFNKGDVLIGQSSSVLTKLAAPGIDGYSLITDSTQAAGIKWGIANGKPTITSYTTSSTLTWNKPSVLSYIVVEVIGAGGGGGGTDAGTRGGGGGGAGGYAKKIIAASLLSVTETVVIGTGGTGGNTGDGSTGGQSGFGTTSFLSASGGSGGTAGNTPPRTGGVGGVGGGGDLNTTGQSGGFGSAPATGTGSPGDGGASYFAGSPGGGGRGGFNASGAQQGVDGQTGAVIITAY